MKKRIIILCDGTWNDLEMRYITNVGRLAQIVGNSGFSNNQPIQQVVYYDGGIGSEENALMRNINGAFGIGMDKNIYEAYRFLVFNYEDGDEVCFYAFSRGCYTIRCLGGLIGKIGLITKDNMKYLSEVMKAYRNQIPLSESKLDGKTKFIQLSLMGCWDTVGALGIPDKIPFLSIDEMVNSKYEFHDTVVGSHINHALHAVAIDEKRKEFEHTPMQKNLSSSKPQIKEVWFPGDHGSVGGGSWGKRGLSNGALRWMVEESKQLGFDLNVNFEYLPDQCHFDPHVYIKEEEGILYTTKSRECTAKLSDLHGSAILRYKQNEDLLEATPLDDVVKNEIVNLNVPDLKIVHSSPKLIDEGKTISARVFSLKERNKSNILVEKGKAYNLKVRRPQCWKDGKLDPCSVLGWDIVADHEQKMPWKDGQPLESGFFHQSIIKMGDGLKIVDGSDWFELVATVGRSKFQSLNIPVPNNEIDDFVVDYTAPTDGELIFAANDAKSRLGIINKYDNNAGWVWVEVSEA